MGVDEWNRHNPEVGIRQSIFCPAARRAITKKQATDDPPRRWAKEALD
jgi:hypothetical protein